MQRYGSKISLADSTASSRITKTNHTHVIIQSDSDNKGVIKYLVLPIKNLVNFGRPLKTNDLVTYKVDLKGRGTNRGKIILFGSEDDCAEQVQILSAVSDENDVDLSGADEIINTSEQESIDRICNDNGINKENVSNQQSSIRMVKKKPKIMEKSSHECRTTTDDDLVSDKPDKKKTASKMKLSKTLDDGLSNNRILTSTFRDVERSNGKASEQSFIQEPTTTTTPVLTKKIGTDRLDGGQKTLDQMLKKVVVGTSSLSKSSITFETSIKSPSTIDRNMPTPINNRTKQAFLTPLQPSSTNTNKKRELSPEGNGFSTDDDNDEDQNNKHQMEIDLAIEDKDYLLKEYNTLHHDHQALEMKYNKLVLAHQQLKQNSLPMPGDSGRNWFIQVGKLLGPKSSQSNTDTIAKNLGIKKSSLLNSCVRDTSSNTTRQVIKLLYSPAELKKGRGKDVTQCKRKLIREFVEQEHGPIDNRPFREAINGVFRSYVHNDKKKMDVTKTDNSTSVKNQKGESSIRPAADKEGPRYFECDEEEDDNDDDTF